MAAVGGREADAAQVYPGCAVPPGKFNHIWYIDPVKGKTAAAGGLGTQATPWNSLQALTNVASGYATPLLNTAPWAHPNPTAGGTRIWEDPPHGGPVGPGDEVLLMSGNYGAINIGRYGVPVNNPVHVSIAAGPGQTPVISSLNISGSSGFAFSGIKFQALAATGDAGQIVNIGDQVAHAMGRVTYVAIPAAGDTISLNGTVWTFVSSVRGPDQISLGSTLAATLTAAATLLNASTDPNTSLMSFSASATAFTATAKAYGTSGNAYTLAASSGTASGSTLAGGIFFPASNIVLDNVIVSAADPSVVSGWTQAQWQANTNYGIIARGSCVSIVNSHILNNHYGVVMGADNSLLDDNEIDHFGDDAVDYAASNITISHNYIHDPMDWNNGAHMDGMQGYPGHFSNITIDSNRIIRQIDPNPAFPTYLQAIDAFDGDWSNLTVTNNVIVTSACWGIGYASVHGGKIINNTVLSDELLRTAGNCKPLVAVGDKTHQGSSSNDVVVRNNLTNGLLIYNLDPNMMMDHNICYGIEGRCQIFTFNADKKPHWGVDKPGIYGDHNIIEGRGADSEFVNFNPAKFAFDLRLKAGARAIGVGNPDGAPSVDFTGARRGNPVDVGAYSFTPK